MRNKIINSMLTKEIVSQIGQKIKKSYSPFDNKAFLNSVFNDEWDTKRIKECVQHVSECVHQTFNLPYSQSLDILLDANKRLEYTYSHLMFPYYVELCGQNYFHESMNALKEFTKTSTSEFAIRYFILQNEQEAMKYIYEWSKDSNFHVRRLASEGCRPLLPWSFKIRQYVKDPTPILPILENLKQDPQIYVQKSVANNLNDINKNHPELILQICNSWNKINDQSTKFILKRACRTILKLGNQDALNLFGVKIGTSFSFSFDIQDTEFYSKDLSQNFKQNKKIPKNNNDECSDESDFENNTISQQNKIKQNQKYQKMLRIEYKIDYLKKNGSYSPKVFIFRGQYALQKEKVSFQGYQNVEQIVTKKHYPGLHYLSIIVNGAEKAKPGQKNLAPLLKVFTIQSRPSIQFLNQVFDDQWREKELKQRMTHVSKAIQQAINKPYIESINILLDVNERLSNNFVNMIFPEFVSLYGIEYLDESMFALKQFTVNSSSELAVRPFILKYGKDAMQYMYRWSKDDNHHVRRLASEGCRPLLPWSFRLSDFVEDPTPILPILDQLKEDPEQYVQKSVANNLNDISKNHPNLVLHICSDWKQINNQATQFIVKRACRTLLKKGNQQALDIFGVGDIESVKVSNLVIHDKNIRIGSQFSFSFDIEDTSNNTSKQNENIQVKNKKIIIQSQENINQTKKMQSQQIKSSKSNSSEDQSDESIYQDEEYEDDDSQNDLEEQQAESILRIEYQIDYLKSNGTHSSKVFMLKNQYKLPQKKITLEGYQKVHQLTTRKHYPGIHHLSIIVNGTEKARTQFNLLKEN
ncbi:hypothetical protein ABPG72_013179 [Tetrahymena utriculariae]